VFASITESGIEDMVVNLIRAVYRTLMRFLRPTCESQERKIKVQEVSSREVIEPFVETLSTAFQHFRLGQLTEAEQLYRQVLQQQPEHPEALHWFGVIVYQSGRVEEALTSLQKSLALNPNDANACNSFGVMLMRQNSLEEAAIYFRRAIVLNPNHFFAHANLGTLRRKQGDLNAAVESLQSALTHNPNDAGTHHDLGTVFHNQGKLEEATIHYKQSIALRPNNAESLTNLGNLLREQGKLNEAIQTLQAAFDINPNSTPVHNGFGLAFLERGNLDLAQAHLRQAIAFSPDDANAHYNLGLVLDKQGNLEEALSYYEKAITLHPKGSPAYANLTNVLEELGRLEEAILNLQKALDLNFHDACIHAALGLAFMYQGNLNLAITHLRQAVSLNPNDAAAHYNLAHALLLTGDLGNGFAEHEWRWQQPQVKNQAPASFGRPEWDGSNLEGKTILLQAEQGFGDVIQFIRYVPLVKARGGRVIVSCQAPLMRLLDTMPDVEQVIDGEETPLEFQTRALLMSLPHILETSLETIPSSVPYLFASINDEIKLNLTSDIQLKVGLVWASGYREENRQLLKYHERKSCPLSLYTALLSIPQINFFSLQVGRNSADIAKLGDKYQMQDLSSKIRDFADTAALVTQMDLIISIDTAAHLAGALGKPIWVLLPFAADWRWLLDRDDTPWYPTMRLFRQSSSGDWEGVIDRVVTALKRFIHDGE